MLPIPPRNGLHCAASKDRHAEQVKVALANVHRVEDNFAMNSSSGIRKYPLSRPFREPTHGATAEIDLPSVAKFHFSSEAADHPVEHMVDGCSGRGATFWSSARPDATEEVVLEFDEPQTIRHLTYEVEERDRERTQEVRCEYSCDGGAHYQGLFVQNYTFSPEGSTLQCENLNFDLHRVTHLRLIITPNRQGSGYATLTSLRIFS